MKERLLFYSFLTVIAGIVIGTSVPFPFIIVIVLAFLSICFLKRKKVAILILILSFSVLITSISNKSYVKTYKGIELTGTVSQLSESESGFSVILDGCRYKEIDGTKVYVYFEQEQNDGGIKEGNVITVFGDAIPTKEKILNPGEYSELKPEIGYAFKAKEYTIEDNGTNGLHGINKLKNTVRETLFLSVDDGESASVLYAMISGDKEYIKKNVIEVFSACGTSHLLAVSGLHIGIILHLIVFALEKLRIRNVLSLAIITSFVLFYSAFTGFSPSVLRAAIMAVALQLSKITGAKYDPLNSLGLAGTLILLIDPFQLFDIAFQLSFSACCGIIWITKYTVNWKILGGIINSAMITVGATIFTLPLQIYYFGTVSVISIFANILLVGVSSFALLLTFLFIIPVVIFPQIEILLAIPGYIMEGIIALSKMLSSVPAITFGTVNMVAIVFVLALMMFLTRFIHVRKKNIVAGVTVLVMLFLSISNATYENNFVKISVPYTEDDSVCVHIEDEKHYIIGLSDKDIDKQINYIKRSVGNNGILILLNSEQAEKLPEAMDKGLTFDELYVAPWLAINNNVLSMGAKRVNEIHTRSGCFEFSSGFKFILGEKVIYIDEKDSDEVYDIAVSTNHKINAHTVITRGENKYAKKLYDIDTCGYTSITIRSN